MLLSIAKSFSRSLDKLTNDEQKTVKVTMIDLMNTPEHPSLQLHRVDNARDKDFWSVRVNDDLRLIVHRGNEGMHVCYVDHHDPAYRWAERRKLETHPVTGAAQMVEIREMVRDFVVPRYVEAPKPLLFAHLSDDTLLRYGVPAEWLEDVKSADEDSLYELGEHLPEEAADALLDLATGITPQVSEPLAGRVDPFAHPDAQRRFRVMEDRVELERALDYPWEQWTIFLHPAQRKLVKKDYSGPARVSGSAGTGKTVVALHRAAHLARQHPEERILLATFSDTLARALNTKFKRLVSGEPTLAERVDVYSMNNIGRRLYKLHIGRPHLIDQTEIATLLEGAAKDAPGTFSSAFLYNEWTQVIDAWNLTDWEDYRSVTRLGRKTRLPERQRQVLWEIFERVRQSLQAQGRITYDRLFHELAEHFSAEVKPPFDIAIVDEAQDISVAQLRFLAALGANRPNALFFAGDLGQRIFQEPFSWKQLGVKIRGRSHNLRINYRTSHQIRRQADRLLDPEISDVDGLVEKRDDTISVFNGPEPTIRVADDETDEIETVAAWVTKRLAESLEPHEIGIIVRSTEEMGRARAAAERASLPYRQLDEDADTTYGYASLCTMHLAKGLEFRAVVVMACDDEVIPQEARIEAISDEADLEEIYNTERHLLYVACTRARDHLLLSGVDPISEFLEDLS